jgi:6,7-dimethyl-8-ribityllumazine synthase
MKRIEGSLLAVPGTIALVATRFNEFIVDALVRGAEDALLRHGMRAEQIELIRVPGAYELAFALKQAAASNRYVGLVALGCVIRGATAHFDHVAGAAASGVQQVALESGLPIGFGVLTVDTIEQGIERAGSKAGNKGAEAALVVLEMLQLKALLT